MIPTGNSVLALEWDRTELRYVWANRTSRRPVIRAMGRIAAPASTEGTPPIEAMLGDLKKSLRIKKGKVIVCISRSEVDEFEATLPPAAQNELAFLVANEAHKHNPTTTDDAQIDFLTMEQHDDLTRRVSIVVYPHERHQQLEELFEQQAWKLASIQLRHVASTQLLGKLLRLDDQRCSVLLNLNQNDADLVILQRAQIALVRSIPLANDLDTTSLVEKLSVEIQRSLMITAAPDQQQGLDAQRMYFFGRADEQSALREQLAQSLNLNVQLMDPIEPFGLSRRKLPERVHQFAGLLGSLLEQPAAQAIDLHTPKCARPTKSWRTRAIVYGVAAALLVSVGIGWCANNISRARQATQDLRAELAKIEKQHDELESRMTIVEYYDNWIKDDVNWLEELHELSNDFPERAKIQVKSMTFSPGNTGNGVLAMNLRAKDNSVIAQLEQNIRDESHQIRINQLSQSESDKEFPWQFGATLLVRKRDRDQYTAASAGATPQPQSDPTEIPFQSSGTEGDQ